MEVSNLPDIVFRVIVRKIPKKLSENYKELSGKYISTKKTIEIMNKNQLEMKHILFNINNTLGGIKSTIDEEEDG